MQTRRVGRLVIGGLVTIVSGLVLLLALLRMVQDMLGPSRYTYTPPWTTHELTLLALLVMTGCGTLVGLAILRIFAVRRIVVGAMLVLVGLPVVLILIVVASFYTLFYVPNRANGTIVSSGQEREYLLHVPSRTTAPSPRRSS